MHIGIIGQPTRIFQNQKIFSELGHQTYHLRRPEELEQLDGVWLSICHAKELETLQKWRSSLQKQAHLAIMGTALGAIALGQNGPLALMDYQASYKKMPHQTAELLRIPSWNDHRLTAIFDWTIHFEQIAPNLGIICQSTERGPIILRQGNFAAVSFVPEETADKSIYQYFLDMVRRSGKRNL